MAIVLGIGSSLNYYFFLINFCNVLNFRLQFALRDDGTFT